ncbi:MAG: hypothetical protein JKY20_12350 [Alphaproteobacteria bacterium]|nr:hypothetical protein [Alphaproteobacteria bacterium]
MHDAVEGDRTGIPSIGVMTTNFVSAAELMARVLGADGYPFVVIDHPVSSATMEKLSEEAIKAVAQSAKLLVEAA